MDVGSGANGATAPSPGLLKTNSVIRANLMRFLEVGWLFDSATDTGLS